MQISCQKDPARIYDHILFFKFLKRTLTFCMRNIAEQCTAVILMCQSSYVCGVSICKNDQIGIEILVAKAKFAPVG